ncbi:holin family protein (plasmid) [Halodesulfovibrio aestuarii]|uniref:Holin of 3TMs, for gene-transfer release n=1 Tax=Halodesulfovibrio aestuarii TaxID=126333 RepID=A0A8G2CC51_9BACT|nr:holin family protein [Halodesulfovibrio aestuarii]SHJ72148.1 Holin of 3TMs, for gene-transfer release [Halodesulfovibrio aestuarii]
MVGLDGILNIGGKLIDRLWPDPETAAKAKLELAKMKQNGELAEMDARYKAITAEANSGDKWTSRARPMFLYVMYGVIGLCVVGSILGIWWPAEMKQAAANMKFMFASIPEPLWMLFGSGYLGYSASRSYDKKQKAKAGL